MCLKLRNKAFHMITLIFIVACFYSIVSTVIVRDNKIYHMINYTNKVDFVLNGCYTERK